VGGYDVELACTEKDFKDVKSEIEIKDKYEITRGFKMGVTVAELFEGVGGFRLGLERSDKDFVNTVWMNQWEPSKKEQDAFNCYEERFKEGEKSNEDIGNVDMEKLRS